MLDLSEKIAGVGRRELEKMLDDGTARKKFNGLVEIQGGKAEDLDRLAEIHKAPVIQEVISEKGGLIKSVDAGQIGQASLELGAGRSKATDPVDFAVGFDKLVKSGEKISDSGVVARVHARTKEAAEKASAAVLSAICVA